MILPALMQIGRGLDRGRSQSESEKMLSGELGDRMSGGGFDLSCCSEVRPLTSKDESGHCKEVDRSLGPLRSVPLFFCWLRKGSAVYSRRRRIVAVGVAPSLSLRCLPSPSSEDLLGASLPAKAASQCLYILRKWILKTPVNMRRRKKMMMT